MSADEDTELRDLVAQTLESNGVLGKIRAQLRASVFLALEEQETIQNKTPFLNPDLKKFMNTKEDLCLPFKPQGLQKLPVVKVDDLWQIVTGLVREFLEYFNLEFSAAVFEPESGYGNEVYEGRNRLARDLNVVESDSTTQLPLLAEIVKRGSGEKSSRSHSGSGTEDLTAKQVAEARKKFREYDRDNSGAIEKDEMRALFMDIFPGFHRNLIDRYVNDEFKAVDRDFSNTIDFSEFLSMYKRLFVLCKSVVSQDVAELTMNSPRQPSRIPSRRKGGSSVESKNKKNLESSESKSSLSSVDKSASPTNVRKDNFFGSDNEDDPFFDDPIPSQDKSKNFAGTKKESNLLNGSSTSNTSKASSGGMTSLAGLPSLTVGSTEKPAKISKENSTEKDIQAIDKKITDLGFDVPDDEDYEDDFDSSKSGSDNVTPRGATPRTGRSDADLKSVDEDIDEDIEEEISVAEDLLKSDASGADDLTTDRTVSPAEQSAAFDYMEDVIAP